MAAAAYAVALGTQLVIVLFDADLEATRTARAARATRCSSPTRDGLATAALAVQRIGALVLIVAGDRA